MLWLSAVIVFGIAGWIFSVMGTFSSELAIGHEQLIHARIPWLVLGGLWFGGALAIVSLMRERRWYGWVVLAAEAVPVVLFSVYFLQLSDLPDSTLRVGAGDVFPAYRLADQDEAVHAVAAGEPRAPALYIFYRGDW